MRAMLQGKRFLGGVGTSVLLALLVCGPALGQQQIEISGKVTAPDGERIRGASVRIRGTTTSAVTDDQGKYSLTAPGDAVLVFNRIGYRGVGVSVGGRTSIDVVMERAVTVLPEVVVTGYTTQKRADITGAVATVDVAGISQQTSTSVLQRLDGQVSGVTVEAGGSPGSRTTVRIRGVSSFQNNDPLYIVDGTPVQDTYLNWLNPSEIGSIQVLKDASAASIYGSRASNGVVIIETKRGRPGQRRVSLDVRTGVATPTRGMDDILTLNALDYFKVVKTSYENAGTAVPRNIYGDPNSPTVPAYIWLDDDALGENNIIGKNIMQQPVVPIYDINGYFASGKAVGLSNLTNPLKIADAAQHDISTNDRIFGNVFAGFDAAHDLSLKTRLGFNLGQNSFHGFSPTTPENSEVTDVNGINENYNLFTEWTWSNTLNYTRTLNQHNLAVLLGQEATKNTNRTEAGSCSNLLNSGVDSRYISDALCDPTTKNVGSSGGQAALLSYFGKADYNFADKYYLSFTLRRDGSSRLGPQHQWGTFPAVGAGWRLSREPFLSHNSLFSNMMLRFGWGITGRQQIPAGRIISQFGGDRGDTFYDIGGTSVTTLRPGFKQTAIGNVDLKWEEQRSTNVGLDLEFLEGRGTFSADVFRRYTSALNVYRRNTNNLLFDPR